MGFFAVDWLHGWRLPSLLSWPVVSWLVLAKRLTECWLTVRFWVARCFITAKLRLNSWRVFLAIDWLHGWRLPSLLSWSVVSWLIWAKRLTECWLTVGWWVAWCFFTAKLRLKIWCFFWAVDWLHGWRLPSLLSWSVVGWLVLAKWLTECWVTVGWWVAWCFFTAKLRLKIWWFFLSSWLTAWLAAPLFASLVGGRLIGFGKETDRIFADCWLVGGSVFFLMQNWD